MNRIDSMDTYIGQGGGLHFLQLFQVRLEETKIYNIISSSLFVFSFPGAFRKVVHIEDRAVEDKQEQQYILLF